MASMIELSLEIENEKMKSNYISLENHFKRKMKYLTISCTTLATLYFCIMIFMLTYVN